MNFLAQQQRRRALAEGLRIGPMIAQTLFFKQSQTHATSFLVEAFFGIYFDQLESDLKARFKRLTAEDLNEIIGQSKIVAFAELTRLDEQSQSENQTEKEHTK